MLSAHGYNDLTHAEQEAFQVHSNRDSKRSRDFNAVGDDCPKIAIQKNPTGVVGSAERKVSARQ